MSLKLGNRDRPKSTVMEESGPNVKLVMVGDSGVGKSCLLEKFLDETSTNNFISTIGVDIKTRSITLNNKTIKIQVWDTGGQQRYRPVLASCYRNAGGVIMVFDVTNRKTFLNIKQWVVEVDEFSEGSNVTRILVGNKADLSDRREVEYESAAEFATSLGMEYIETSVIGEPANIQEAFMELVKKSIQE